MEIVPLGPEHRSELERFSCGSGPQRSWVHEVEAMIRERLADELAHPTSSVEAIGLRDDAGTLCGLAAWLPEGVDPEVWQIALVAVSVGHHLRGLGRALKTEVLRRARLAGVRVVVSVVHVDNEAMLRVNAKLGASMVVDPENGDYMICTMSAPFEP